MFGHWEKLSQSWIPWHGRAWLHLGERTRNQIRIEWKTLSNRWAISFSLDPDEGEALFALCFGLVSLYVGASVPSFIMKKVLPGRESRYTPGFILLEGREISLRFFDGGPWWVLWMDPDEAHRTDPKWRRGHLDFRELFFGRMDYERTELGAPEGAAVWMPEGAYAARFTPYEAIRTRRRWPRRPLRSVERGWDIKIENGIPTESDDGIYGLGVAGASLREAAANVRERVLESRRRHSGSRDWRPSTGMAS